MITAKFSGVWKFRNFTVDKIRWYLMKFQGWFTMKNVCCGYPVLVKIDFPGNFIWYPLHMNFEENWLKLFYIEDHFIWKLNEPSASLINFIWNDHSCKILFIIWPFQYDFIAFKVCSFQWKKLHYCHRHRHYITCFHQKCYVTCGYSFIYDMTLSTE